MNHPVIVQLGQSGDSFTETNGRERVNIDRQPAGLNFYSVHFSTASPGVVQIEHGPNSFHVSHVLSISGVEDVDFLHDGIASLDVNAGVTASAVIGHLEARDGIMKLLQNLQEAGWRRVIDRGEARTKARSSLLYAYIDNLNGLDLRYVPTVVEWMRLGSKACWYLYADGVYLTLQFRRDAKHMNLNLPGAYLLSFEFKTEAEHSRGYFGPADRARWLELWPEREKELQQERVASEAKARTLGLEIDTNYQDPPIVAAKLRPR